LLGKGLGRVSVAFQYFALISAIKDFAFAPTATADDLVCIFGAEVGLVLDELGLDAEDGS
jgi:hypothetical protein